MSAYYNEFEPYAADWLENLIAAGHLPAGDVDRRDIREVSADDLEGYDECHFFAGIGGWPYALRLAGWRGPVWTGSCPCQPLSSAGQQKGHADQRHLWPAFYRLIAERRPAAVFGEQVASKDGREWLAGVRADLEDAGYAVGAADLCAAGAGAPHIRQRLFWVADANGGNAGAKGLQRGGQHGQLAQDNGASRVADARRDECGTGRDAGTDGRTAAEPAGLRDPGRLADDEHDGQRQHGRSLEGAPSRDQGQGDQRQRLRPDAGDGGAAGRLGDAAVVRRAGQPETGSGSQVAARGPGSAGRLGDAAGGRRQGDQRRARPGGEPEPAGPGFWRDFDLVPCADGKARRVGPGTFPLAHGIPQRVGKLRAYGNAIVPQAGAAFVSAFMECRP